MIPFLDVRSWEIEAGVKSTVARGLGTDRTQLTGLKVFAWADDILHLIYTIYDKCNNTPLLSDTQAILESAGL